MLIIKRSNCINTASGIVLSASDRPVCTPDGRTDINTTGPPDDEHSVARNV